MTRCPIVRRAPPGPAIVRCPVGVLMSILLLPANVTIDGAAWLFLVPLTMCGAPFLTTVMYEPAALRLTLTTPFTLALGRTVRGWRLCRWGTGAVIGLT